jgi:tetratricopeptide (TPR) repeat protein
VALLDQAYRALHVDGNPQLVLDILAPHLEEFKDPNDLAKALEYLGGAELGLGHYQLAAVYYERLVQLSPTPQNHFILARIYDTSGDLENALKYILLYLQSDDPELTDDLRTMLQDRANQIQTILTNSTPTAAQ